jgi:hypothetical protein
MATMTASWALAGGSAGALLTAVLLLSGRVHPDALLLTAGFFALGGCMLGTVHGAVLGYLGRPALMRSDASRPLLATLLATVLAVGAALGYATWMALAASLARADHPAGWIALLAALPFAIAGIAWATYLGWHALELAYDRWPDHRIGSFLVLGAFVVLLAIFLALQPAVPGTELQLSPFASTMLAALVTLWLAAPAIYFGLRLMHRRR